MHRAASRVFGEFSKDDLDREYSPSSLVGSIDSLLDDWARRSAVARSECDVACGLRYGVGAGRTLDYFPSNVAASPVLIFIHGGYWQELTKDESSFLAPAFVRFGAAFVALDYPLAPAASLPEISASCEEAVVWLAAHAEVLGFDPARIFLCGLSAGAHLAAMVATSSNASLLHGVIAVSGVYDLEPVRHSYVNDVLRLDRSTAAGCSPLRRVRRGLPPLLVAHGDNETSEFKRQSQEMAATWAAAGNWCELIEARRRHHFDVIDACADPRTNLGRAILEWMELTTR